MKKTLLLIISTLLLGLGCYTTTHATVRTVSKNGEAQFSEVTAALAAATAGDTLYVSAGSYGNISIDKPISIIGTGRNPQKQNTGKTIMGDITLTGGFNGVTINGVEFGNLYNEDTETVTVGASTTTTNTACNFIQILNCKFANFYNRGSDILIRNCIVRGMYDHQTSSVSVSIQNILIENSVIGSNNDNYSAGTFTAGGNAIFKNCLFLKNISNLVGLTNYDLTSFMFKNCIFYFSTQNSQGSNNTFQNCISLGTMLASPSGSNTITNCLANTDPLFVSAATGDFSYSKNYHLLPTSPAIGAGIGGVDIGIYGGVAPFTVGGEPGIAQVRQMNPAVGSVAPGSTMQINVVATKGQ